MPQPHGRASTTPDLTRFLQHPWELPGKVTWTPDFPSSIAFSLITKFLPLYYSRCSLLIQSHLSLCWFYFTEYAKKVKWQSWESMLDYLVEVALSRMYHLALPGMPVNVVFGLQQSHTVILFPAMISWSKVSVFFLAGIRCVHVRN